MAVNLKINRKLLLNAFFPFVQLNRTLFLPSMHILKREKRENVCITPSPPLVPEFPSKFQWIFFRFTVHEARLSKLRREKHAADGCTSS